MKATPLAIKSLFGGSRGAGRGGITYATVTLKTVSVTYLLALDVTFNIRYYHKLTLLSNSLIRYPHMDAHLYTVACLIWLTSVSASLIG